MIVMFIVTIIAIMPKIALKTVLSLQWGVYIVDANEDFSASKN
jgi:hypothetical protein